MHFHSLAFSSSHFMKTIRTIISLAAILFSSCSNENANTLDISGNPPTAELFAPGIISTNLYERDIAISPDGTEIVFTLGDYRQIKRGLVIVKKSGSDWSNKEILSFSGLYDDIEPFFSLDGNKLYFVSNRPVDDDTTRKDYNIWISERTADGWNDPVPLPSVINTTHDEFYPSVSQNNNLYFTSARENGIGSEDIYISRIADGVYSEPTPLDTSVNSATYEFNAYVNPEETLIIFTSYGRKDDMGGGDLYYSLKDSSGIWQSAVNMGPEINSEYLDFCPFVDNKRGNLYFTSDRTSNSRIRMETTMELENFANQILNGTGNIYRIHIDKAIPGL